jgi:hypothetical protein
MSPQSEEVTAIWKVDRALRSKIGNLTRLLSPDGLEAAMMTSTLLYSRLTFARLLMSKHVKLYLLLFLQRRRPLY